MGVRVVDVAQGDGKSRDPSRIGGKVLLLPFQGSDEKGRENANGENCEWQTWCARALIPLPGGRYFPA